MRGPQQDSLCQGGRGRAVQHWESHAGTGAGREVEGERGGESAPSRRGKGGQGPVLGWEKGYWAPEEGKGTGHYLGYGEGSWDTGQRMETGGQGAIQRMRRGDREQSGDEKRDGAPSGEGHLAAQRLPPAGLPLGWLGPRGHAASCAQRAPVGAAQQLQRRLRGRAVARGRRSCFLERQQAAAERRAAGLHGALPAVVGALGTREGPVFLRPESHHARPAKAMAAVGAHRVAGRTLAQGAGGLAGARGERQGGSGGALEGADRDANKGRTGGWESPGPGRTKSAAGESGTGMR